MKTTGENRGIKPAQLSYFFEFYRYLFAEKRRELAVFILITFLLPVGPYIYVALKLINDTNVHRLSFYGDGSMITLCAGILCSYFVMLFEYGDEDEKMDNTLTNLLLVVVYVILFLIFSECQLNFERDWCFNTQIITLSGVLVLVTFFAASYFNFKKNFNYPEVSKYIKGSEQKYIEEKTEQTNKTDEDIEL